VRLQKLIKVGGEEACDLHQENTLDAGRRSSVTRTYSCSLRNAARHGLNRYGRGVLTQALSSL